MRYLYCGNSDAMPALGLGTWKSSPGEVYEAVRQAIGMGYRHFDCAAIYGNEAEIGQALADAMAAGELLRNDLWITSKLWNNAHSSAAVRPALLATLNDLRLDYLDLYLIHWPVVFRDGVGFPQSLEDFHTLEEVPIAETWEALESCVDEGLIRHIGVSNFSARKLGALLKTCRILPAVDQVEMHPLLAQRRLKKFCDDNEILMTAYAPLGSRDRNPAFKPKDEPNLLEQGVIGDIAQSRRLTPAQILLAWALNRATSVIPKSVNSERMRQNLAAADIELTAEEMSRIDALDRHYRYITGAFLAGKNSPYTIGGIWDE